MEIDQKTEKQSIKYNIGYFTDTYHPQLNGVVSSIDSFEKELRIMGHNIYIFAPEYKENSLYIEKEKNVFRYPSVSYPFYKEFRVAWPYSIQYKKFRKLKIDIYHLHSPFSIGIFGFFLSKFYKAPVIMTYHTFWKDYGPRYAPYLPKTMVEFLAVTMSKKFCNRLDLVIVPSNAMKKEVESYGLTTKIEVVPSGFTLDDWDINHKKNIHEQYNIPTKDKILLYVGRIGAEKNIMLLLESFQAVQKNHPNTHLVIAGGGPALDDCLTKAKELQIDDKITFTGIMGRKEVLGTMMKSDIFVFPSKTETQGLVVLEALACGLPVVAINRMGSIDYLKDGKGGILTDPTIESFANGIIKLLEHDNIDEVKNQAKDKAKKYTTKAVAEKLVSIYDEVYFTKKKNKTKRRKRLHE